MAESSTRMTGDDMSTIGHADAGRTNLAVLSQSASNPGAAPPRLFEVKTTHATMLLVELSTGLITHGQPATGKTDRVLVWAPDSHRSHCFLFAPRTARRPLLLKHDLDRDSVIGLVLARQEDGSVALIQPFSRHYLCAVVDALAQVEVTADRTQLGSWERFTLRETADAPDDVIADVREFEQLLQQTGSAPAALYALASAPGGVPPAGLIALFRLLPPCELDWLGRGLGRNKVARDAFAALCAGDLWAREALPGLERDQSTRTFQRSIDESMDELATYGLYGRYVSLGQVCNAFARRDRAPTRGLCIVATARNEGLYLLEWIAYHLALGVEAFFIYTNDNIDGSDKLLDSLVKAGIINWISNKTQPGVSPQYKAYGHAFQILPEVLDYRWVAVVDLDEFIAVDPAKYRSIPEFIATQEVDKTDAIALSWVMYGPSRQSMFDERPVTRRFTQRDSNVNAHVKSISRPQFFIHTHCHYPIWDGYAALTMRDAEGRVHQMSRGADESAFSSVPSDRHAWINHYFSKSAEEFILRRSFNRGDIGLSLSASADYFSAATAQMFVDQFRATGLIDDRRAIDATPNLEADIAALRSLPGVHQAMLGIERSYRDRLRQLARVLAEDQRFRQPDTNERWFADILATSEMRAEIGASNDVPVETDVAALVDTVRCPTTARRFAAPSIVNAQFARVMKGAGMASQGLVIDLGVSEGNDTAYYLSKGFRVIAVEADPATCDNLRQRFRSEIDVGNLMLLNFAASNSFGELLDIFVHKDHQAVSGIAKRAELSDNYILHRVMTIDWLTLVAQAGIPRYLKVDIEGNEGPFLQGMLGSPTLPEFVSVECYTFEPIAMLQQLGYRRFKFVDQNPPGGFVLPARQIEGLQISSANFAHASGPFGLDVFHDGDWLNADGVRPAWEATAAQLGQTWFDCHAWQPN